MIRYHFLLPASGWQQSARSLQYLVLDEFHTYDLVKGFAHGGLLVAERGAPQPEPPRRVVRLVAGITAALAVVSLTSSDKPWQRSNRPSVVCSTPVTSHSSSRTMTTEPGAMPIFAESCMVDKLQPSLPLQPMK